MTKWLWLREAPVYTVCINLGSELERSWQMANMNAISRKDKKRRELLIQMETVCVSRIIQSA
jgi:hypothetical protein